MFPEAYVQIQIELLYTPAIVPSETLHQECNLAGYIDKWHCHARTCWRSFLTMILSTELS